MSPFPISRPVVRSLSVIAISVLLVAISLVWASRQQAGSPSLNSRRNHSSLSLVADKGVITPQAATITVNSLSDVANGTDGVCTLREAITAANNDAASGVTSGECVAGTSSGSDVISFTVTGTINLASALPDISTDMSITGPGSSQLTVRRQSGSFYRIFTITTGTVSLSAITVSDGITPITGGLPTSAGGGIRNAATLTMNNVVVTGNQTNEGTVAGSGAGGGIFNSGTLTMTNSSVLSNSTGVSSLGGAGNDGGGIANIGGTLSITDSLISGNLTGATQNSSGVSGNGGGIFSSGSLTLTNSTISNNLTGSGNASVFGRRGAGIYTAGTATMVNCTVINNTTGVSGGFHGSGGGIYNGATLTIVGSTITANDGDDGAGIYNDSTLQMTNSTISGNYKVGLVNNTGAHGKLTNCTVTLNQTGGVLFGFLSYRNTILAGNNNYDITAGSDCTSLGHNLVGNPMATCFSTSQGDQLGVDPKLGPLANNGGPTQTHALLPNSPALDAGDDCVTGPAVCANPDPVFAVDQRGFNRKVDGPDPDAVATVDIGAYEMQTPLANLADTSANEDTQLMIPFDGGDTSTITSVTASSSNPALVPNDSAHLSAVITGSTGFVTINPAADANGTTNITVTINRSVGGPDTRTFMLTVNPVNDAPSFTKGPDQTVNEDSGAQAITNWATAITTGPPDESASALPQTWTFQIVGNTNPALFSAAPAISLGGTLSYTPAANANGTATITVNLKDSGGTANGGVDTSASQTFTITVNSVNDAPSFTKGADQMVNEDAAAQTVTNWATAISRGPADESGQTLTFQITNNTNASLFSVGPSISSTGTLTYTAAANANGSATIMINLKDNGGTSNGGADTSAPQTFNININPVNDVPSFTKGANPTANEDSGPQTVNNWATSISPGGGADEAGQTLTFQILGNGNPSIFSTAPAVSANGTLTFTPAANANGSSVITIALKDNGGTFFGGVDTSASQTFTIFVTPVNDAPSFTKGADQTVNNNAGTQTVNNWATNITAGPGDESAQTLTFQVTGNSNSALFATAPAISSSGALTYRPAVNQGGTATITINLKDSGGTANGGVDTSASQTFNITVTPIGGFIDFAASTGNTTENSGSTTVNVVRTGNTAGVVTVNYATNADTGVPCSTANGVASPKCDFTAALGTLTFAVGETSKPITILISQDSFVEGPEAITLTLSNPTAGAALGTQSSMAVTIADDATEPPTNIIDDPNQFVRMHYHDFLNREGDQSGLDFWTGQMSNCGSPDLLVCRVNVSGAFFLSIEFQQTGYLVERIYKSSYGDATGTSTIGGSHQIFVPVVRANEFLADTQRVGRGVVVGQNGWETVLENNKQAYALEFVQTSRFITAFPTSMIPAQFVDKLNQNAGNVLAQTERTMAINLFGNAADTTNVTARSQALRRVAEDPDLINAEANRAFVLTEYIGYLRRNPNDAPEPTLDYTGYDFWLQKLNQFNGNYIQAEMVKAFIASDEYRKRFGP